MVDYRKNTIQTHAQLKRDVDQHSFDCQEIRVANTRTYVLSVSEQDDPRQWQGISREENPFLAISRICFHYC